MVMCVVLCASACSAVPLFGSYNRYNKDKDNHRQKSRSGEQEGASIWKLLTVKPEDNPKLLHEAHSWDENEKLEELIYLSQLAENEERAQTAKT